MKQKSFLFVYFREKTFYLFEANKNVQEGIFSSDENIENFLKEKNPDYVELVFSKPKIFTRKISFPLFSINNVSLILKQEIADFFPIPLSQLDIYWYPSERKKDGCEITILGFDRKTIVFWDNLQKKYSFKVQTSFEGFVLSNFIKKTLGKTDYGIVFIDSAYIVFYKIQNGLITDMVSAFFNNDEDLKTFSLYFSDNPVKEKIYVTGSADKSGLLGIPLEFIPIPAFSDSMPVFNILKRSGLKPSFKIYLLKEKHNIPVSFFIVGFVYLILVLFLIKPVFDVKRYRIQIEQTNKKMADVFKKEFPDIKNIVNPLIQAEEKIKNLQTTGKDIFTVSPLFVMEKITHIMPPAINFNVLQISVTGNTIFLSCTTDTLQTLNKITSVFTKDLFFTDVKPGDISFPSGSVKFNLILKINEAQNGAE